MPGILNRWKIVSVVETILLVDGESASRDPMKFILELNGYRVIEAVHGIEALQVLNEWAGEIQLVLCASELQDMSGSEWMSQYRFMGPEIPALVLTDHDTVEVLEMETGSAFGGMPAKPPAPTRLMRKIRSALDEHFFERCNRASAA